MTKLATNQIRDTVATHSLLPANLQDVLVSMLEEDRNMRARSVKEILERLTLRKIVALGLAATESSDESAPTVQFGAPELVSVTTPQDSAMDAAMARRKARLRSLLDEM